MFEKAESEVKSFRRIKTAYFNFVTKNFYRSLLFATLVSFFLLFIVVISINIAFDNEGKSKQIDYLQAHNDTAVALDHVRLCIESSRESRELADFHCKRAIRLYKEASNSAERTINPDTLNNKDYFTMEVDLKDYFRTIEYLKAMNKPKPFFQKYKLLFISDWTLALFLVIIIGIWLWHIFEYDKRERSTNTSS